MLGFAESISFLITGLILVVVLLRVLMLVHAQVKKVKELESRMNAVENMEANEK